ncbi:MAG: SH3 domain-containing protein [Chloroflexota bacterium]
MRKLIALLILLFSVMPVIAHDVEPTDLGPIHPAPTPAQPIEEYAQLISIDEPMTQYELSQNFNLCWEFLHQQTYHWYVAGFPAGDYYLLPDLLPCYNETGQRLKFYENWEILEQPVYSNMHVHITQEGETLVDLSYQYNVCMWDIRAENGRHLSRQYTLISSTDLLAIGQEVFIPETRPCYNEQGQHLRYDTNGELTSLGDGFWIPYTELHIEKINHNICYDVILVANGVETLHDLQDYIKPNSQTQDTEYHILDLWIPDEHPPCYEIHEFRTSLDEYIPDLKTTIGQRLNICASEIEFRYEETSNSRVYTYFVPIDATPCDVSRNVVNHVDTDTLIQLLTPTPFPTATPYTPPPTATVTPTSIYTQTPTPSQPQVIVLNGANIHSGPSTAFQPPIGTIAAGEHANILAVHPSGRWYLIEHQNGDGWINSSLVETVGDLSSLPSEWGLPTPTSVVHNYAGDEQSNIVTVTSAPSVTPAVLAPSLTPFITPISVEPPPRERISIHIDRATYISYVSYQHNICIDDILAEPANRSWVNDTSHDWEIWGIALIPENTTVFLPLDTTLACYESISVHAEHVYSIAEQHNVCIEALLRQRNNWRNVNDVVTLNIPLYEPCYDDNGHRLTYLDAEISEDRMLITPIRLPFDIYVVPRTMSLFELSQAVNVCIPDLMRYNRFNGFAHTTSNYSWRNDVAAVEGLEVFIPDVPHCYHEETGNTLLYVDANGNPLDIPVDSGEILTYAKGGWGVLAQYYNVCYNRIIDYNINYLPHETQRPAWHDDGSRIIRILQSDYNGATGLVIHASDVVRIPTDRPPCYDYDFDVDKPYNDIRVRYLRYACYDYPIDMTQPNPDAVQNIDGNYCYNIDDPETVIWENGQAYRVQSRIDPETGFGHPVPYIAWCYGVDVDDVIMHADNDVMMIYPTREVVLPLPTRTCYLSEDDGAEIVHYIQAGESVYSIAWQYGKLPI